MVSLVGLIIGVGIGLFLPGTLYSLLDRILPHPNGYGSDRWLFEGVQGIGPAIGMMFCGGISVPLFTVALALSLVLQRRTTIYLCLISAFVLWAFHTFILQTLPPFSQFKHIWLTCGLVPSLSIIGLLLIAAYQYYAVKREAEING